jgi:hypothetical protein
MGRNGPSEARGYRYLQVRCQACREAAFIDLTEVRRHADTPVWKLEGALACQPCRERGPRTPWHDRTAVERPRRCRPPASFAPLRLVRDEQPPTCSALRAG